MDFDIVNDGLVFLPAGEVHVNSSVAPVGSASRTVELDWETQTHTDIINLLVGYASKKLRSAFLYQETERRKSTGL